MNKIISKKHQFSTVYICYGNGDGTFDSYSDGDSYGHGYGYGSGCGNGDGGIDGLADGCGNGYGTMCRKYITSVSDPVCLSPLQFLTKEKGIVIWDEAWKLATEEEKLVLIQWMNLK
jgi:hypothetical protein